MNPQPKPQRELDAAYLDYVRKQVCCVSGRTPVDAHHVRLGNVGGVGTKAPDRMAIPLHRDYHLEFHDLGMMEFETKYGIDCAEIVLKLVRGYRPPKARKVSPKSTVRHLLVRCECGASHRIPVSKAAVSTNAAAYQCPVLKTLVQASWRKSA